MDTGSDSPYRPPESPLERDWKAQGVGGSVERALRGEVGFSIGDVIGEAWHLVSGSKGVILGLGALALAVNVVLQLVLSSLIVGSGAGDEPPLAMAEGMLMGVLAGAMISPINAAVLVYAIKRAADDPGASFNTLSQSIAALAPVMGTFVLTTVLTYIGVLLLLIPGIYLAIAYTFALPLVVEKRMGVWEAMETSRRAVTHCWFRMAGLILCMGFIVTIGGVLTLGIGLVWLLPMLVLGIGVVYRNLFGYEGHAI